jgi:hypothetical protein
MTGQENDWKRVTARLSVKTSTMGRQRPFEYSQQGQDSLNSEALILSPAFPGEEGCAARGFCCL